MSHVAKNMENRFRPCRRISSFEFMKASEDE